MVRGWVPWVVPAVCWVTAGWVWVITALLVCPVIRGASRTSSGVSWRSVGRVKLTARRSTGVVRMGRSLLRRNLVLRGVDTGGGVDLPRGGVLLGGGGS